MNERYSLHYASKDGYVVIQVRGDNEVPVAEVLYRINSEYILQ